MRMPWSKEPRIHLDIKEVEASRAIFMGAKELPRIRIAMTTEDNQKIDFELELADSAKLIEEMTMAYYSAVPELKTRRHTF